jgi:photosystem II stability/assembly factor-like uncharacterized protein
MNRPTLSLLLAAAGVIAGAYSQEGVSPQAAGSPASPPSSLEYSGRPIQLPFQCSNEDIQWAGLTCSAEEPCPIYLELSTVEPAGNRVFVAGNLHSQAVTLYSTLLSTEDGGRTWTEPVARIRGAVLDRIQFLNAEIGWVSGHLDFPLPKDPFLLVTSDGGKTWRQQTIFSESAENRLGLIDQFFFRAADDGVLIIDRGQGSAEDRWERYESQNAGASWTIKESSSKPLRLTETYKPRSDWRLRADGPSNSFHVERQREGKWTTAATFAVRAGLCQPEP